MLTPDQIAAAQKAHLDVVLGLMQRTMEGVARLSALNLATVRDAVDNAAQQSQAMMGARDAQELLSVQLSVLRPLIDRTRNYSQQLQQIAADQQAGLAQSIEERTVRLQQALDSLMREALAAGPADAEAALRTLSSMVGAASEAAESMRQVWSGAGATPPRPPRPGR